MCDKCREAQTMALLMQYGQATYVLAMSLRTLRHESLNELGDAAAIAASLKMFLDGLVDDIIEPGDNRLSKSQAAGILRRIRMRLDQAIEAVEIGGITPHDHGEVLP